MTVAADVIDTMTSLHDPGKAEHLSRFFKTGKGEYGEGDKFLGITVPQTRAIVKHYKSVADCDDIMALISSKWHEIRLAGFLLLAELFKAAIKQGLTDIAKSLLELYLANIDKGNNWDLVDLVAPEILGQWICLYPDDEKLLYELAQTERLWHQRVAIVATFPLIKKGRFRPTFRLAESYLKHRHDLIHKATGWMLREIGKRGGESELIEFLWNYKDDMPRTMLRYAIEKFSEADRRNFMLRN